MKDKPLIRAIGDKDGRIADCKKFKHQWNITTRLLGTGTPVELCGWCGSLRRIEERNASG